MRILVVLLATLWVSGAEAQTTLKTGDALNISVLQDSKLDREVLVDSGGQIAFPLAGHIRAAGLTPQALETIIKSRLQKNYKEEALEVTVSLANVTSPEDDLKPKVFITGEVLRPGPYTVRQPTTLMQAISLAGGLGPFAAKRRVQVRRQTNSGETIYVFDYRAYEAGQDLEGNISLRAGDVIMVPERGLFE